MAKKQVYAGPVVVDWIDARATGGWHPSRKSAKKASPPLSCKTIGWLVAQTKSRVTVAQNVSEKGHFADLMTIPTGMIVQVTELTLPTGDKPRAGFTIPT